MSDSFSYTNSSDVAHSYCRRGDDSIVKHFAGYFIHFTVCNETTPHGDGVLMLAMAGEQRKRYEMNCYWMYRVRCEKECTFSGAAGRGASAPGSILGIFHAKNSFPFCKFFSAIQKSSIFMAMHDYVVQLCFVVRAPRKLSLVRLTFGIQNNNYIE